MSDEIDRLRAIIIEVGVIASMCRHDMQGRLSDDEHHRAFRALTQIVNECKSANGGRPR